jgi:hypothetical protein
LVTDANGHYWKDVTDSWRNIGKVIRALGVHDGRSRASPMVGFVTGEIYNIKSRNGIDSSNGIAKFLLVSKDDIRITVLPKWQNN